MSNATLAVNVAGITANLTGSISAQLTVPTGASSPKSSLPTSLQFNGSMTSSVNSSA